MPTSVRSQAAATAADVPRAEKLPGNVPSPSPASGGWGRLWLEGAGAAILLGPGLVWNVLSPSNLYTYHHLLPLHTVTRAVAADLILLSVAGMFAVRLLERASGDLAHRADGSRRKVVDLIWAVWLGLLAARGMQGLLVAELVSWDQVSASRAFLLVAGGLMLVAAISASRYERIVRGLRYAVLLLGLSILWIVPTLAVRSHRQQAYDLEQFSKVLPAPPAGHRRIVWLLFDGLSYDQVFEHRWPGLALPNFDRLHAQSVTFSGMKPDGSYTEDVVPSLLMGKRIVEVRGTADGGMLYRSAKQGPWQRFDGSASLFADAEREGWTTGLIGIFNPYCRLLRNQLDSCWMDLPPAAYGMSRDESTPANLAALSSELWENPFPISADKRPSQATPLSEIAAVDVADRLIANERVDFCFVHLGVPHPPGHYDRKTGRLLTGGSYIDNLALADRILERLLADVAKTDAAGRTTVVVSSDHSWRVWLWRNAFGWTREDEAASEEGHGFDPRPTLLVRFPGETSSFVVRRPVPLLAMHDLLEGTLGGEIGNAQQLQDWAARQ